MCGGAINSPADAAALGRRARPTSSGRSAIDVVHDLPGVGEHLQDHLEVYVQHACTQPVSMAPYLKWRYRPWIGFRWLFFRSGPGATNHFEAGGFARSNDDVAYPNLMFHFLPIAVRYDGSAPAERPRLPGAHRADVLGRAGFGEDHELRSRGSTRRSASTTSRRTRTVESGSRRSTRRDGSSGSPRSAPFDGGELSPGASVETDEEILDWVARDGETALHPSCTCRMGTDEMSVVDPATMRVHGLDGLRVVDASVFPYVTNGNIYAPVMMVAEKAADLILGNTPLEPEPIEFFRRDEPEA